MNKALDYFYGNELASNVWLSKYALKKDGKIVESTPADMHVRMATEFARIEAKYDSHLSYEIIEHEFLNWQVIPQGSVMSQLGNTGQIGSLSNCIVLPKVHDSYGGISYTDQQLAQVMKRRCGAGIDLSTLRPSGSPVSNAAQTSTGAVSFMHRFSGTTREVAQDGRRGALMISMDIRHPEAEEFALIKQDLSKVTGANISLKLTDDFMRRVENDQDFLHCFPIEKYSEDSYGDAKDTPYGVLETWANAKVKKVRAKGLWDNIIKAAHNTAEPGLIFWDRQHYYSPSSLYKEFENISTNPCSEIAMGNDSCRLIATNMFTCVEYPFSHSARFDYEQWYLLCYNTMYLMDDLVDLELEHIERILNKIEHDDEPTHIKAIEKATWVQLRGTGVRGRRTGAGITAVADTLAALGFKYDSPAALAIFDQIMATKLRAELDATIQMAETRGAFPAFDAKLEAEWAEDNTTFFYFIKNQFPTQWERMQRVGRRNISWSTIAPTGSLSLLAQMSKKHFGTSSGIEPVFKVFYIRRKKINALDKDSRVDFTDASGDKWQEFPVFHEGFKMWYEVNQTELGMEGVNLEDIKGVDLGCLIALSPYAGATAEEINWENRVRLQAIAQKYITHSISSTINLPANVTTEEVSRIYMESWKQGLKGITVYREGSRSGVLVSAAGLPPTEEGLTYRDAPKRPKELKAQMFPVKAMGDSYGVIIGFLNGKPYEVFAFQYDSENKYKPTAGLGIITKSKKDYDFAYDDEREGFAGLKHRGNMRDEQVLTRLVSGMLRHGVDPIFIVQQIEKCPLDITSFGKALARVIKKLIPEKELLSKSKCNECKSTNIRYEEGCAKCIDCGSNKCS
jgi:ribonucleoside-diphosphate reductase alpha chain